MDRSFDPVREQHYEALLQKKVLELCEAYSCKVYLFGSRARGEGRRSSDFDIGIEGLDEKSFYRIKGDIEDWVEESPIPHTVDVVNFSQCEETFLQNARKGAKVWKTG